MIFFFCPYHPALVHCPDGFSVYTECKNHLEQESNLILAKIILPGYLYLYNKENKQSIVRTYL